MASSIQIPVTQTGLEASIEAAAKRAGRNLQINLGTNAKSISSLSQPLGKITGQADEFTKSMEAANARVFAFGASVGIVNMVAKAFGALVKNTIAVESSLAEINVVLGKNSQELDKFGNKLFDLAKATGQTFDTVAQGALELSRQGLNATDTIKRLNDALILSRLSGLDATQSVEGLTAAINSFKEAGISSEQIVNKLVNVSQKYAVSEKDLIEGIKRSASVANQAGVSFDQLVGIITTVQERTARGGAVIGNSFKTIFSKIQDKGALQDLQTLGIQVTDTAGKILPATSILENLAKQFDSLSQTQQTDIAKKLGGVYQLSNLLAALKDLGKEQSQYNNIVQLSATSTTQAYQKNAALNETLASIINKVTLSAEQLGATLGKIGMTDSAKNLLNFFNSLLEGIQNVLGEQSAMGDFVRGLVKGIGNLVSGPGLALFGAIIAKLSKDLVEFGFSSLKSFFKIGDAAKEISNVQNVIANTLLTNKNIQSQILAIENSALSVEEKRAAQTKFFTEALNTQLAVMNQMKGLAISIAPGVYSGTGAKGVKGAAGGYMPALAKESSDIKKGVGGARSGDRPVVIPNFAFGGGQRGSMVAHTGEYIVPNFANGGSAIFNRNMVQSMGLPSGAKKIGAAGGFVPNFAAIDKFQETFGLARSTVQKEWNAFRAYYPNAPINAFSAEPNVINAYKTWRTSESRSISKVQSKESSSLSKLSNADKEARIGFIYSGNQPVNENRVIDVKGQSVPVKFLSVVAEPADFLYKEVRKNAIQTAKTYAENIGVHPDMVNENQFESILNQSFNEGALQSVVGTIFEAALQGSIGSPPNKINQNFDIPNQSQMKSLANSFGKLDPNHKNAGLSSALNKLVVGDFKNSLNSNNVSSLAAKIARENINQGKISTGSKGYIPNFANPLEQAVGREMAAGVPSSQIYIDKNPSLKSAANPMGLMVANRRDEPNGGSQGINRAIKEGRNPKTYGASLGFVPNYAKKRYGSKSMPKQTASIGSPIGAEADPEIAVAKKDMLGTIFALQAGLSVLNGATNDASSKLGQFVNQIGESLGAITTVSFAVQGLKGMVSETSKASKAINQFGTATIIATSYYEGLKLFFNTLKVINKDFDKASESFANFSDQLSKFKLPEILGEKTQLQKTQEKNIVSNLVKNAEYDAYKNAGFNITGSLLDTISGDKLSGREDVEKSVMQIREARLLSDQQIKEIITAYKQAGGNAEKAASLISDFAANQIALSNTLLPMVQEYNATGAKTKNEDNAFVEKFGKNKVAAKIYLDLVRKQKEQEASRQSEIDNQKSQQTAGQFYINTSKFKSEYQFQQNLSKLKNQALEDELKIRQQIFKIENDLSLTEDDRKKQLAELNHELQYSSDLLSANEKKSETLNGATKKALENLTLPSGVEYDKAFGSLKDAIDKNLPGLQDFVGTDVFAYAVKSIIPEDLKNAPDLARQLTEALQDALLQYQNITDEKDKQDKLSKQDLENAKNTIDLARKQAEAEQNINSAIEFRKNRSELSLQYKKLSIDKESLSINQQIESIKNNYLMSELDKAKQIVELEKQKRNLSQQSVELDTTEKRLQLEEEINDKIRARIQSSTEIGDLTKNNIISNNIGQSPENYLNNLPANSTLYKDIKNQLDIYAQRKGLIEGQKQIAIAGLKESGETPEQTYLRKVSDGLSGGIKEGMLAIKNQTDLFAFELGEKIPQLFSDNMSQAISEMIDGTKSFEDAFKGAIYNISKEINSSIIKNFVNKTISGSNSIFGSIFQERASGGPIVGGSGTKDDVPAMLMGGEFVINKKAAQKYGPHFLNALNNGSINAYAKGGKVQKGPQGNYFTPSQYGLGSISGSQNLLDFASQAYTGGSRDKIINKGRFASIGLEAESGRLTNFGRRNGPAAEALRSAKEEAFGLYLQDYQAKQELKKQEKAQSKATRNQLIMMAATMVGGAAIKAGVSGFGNAYNASTQTGMARYWDATKGIWSGAEGMGGLSNMFSKSGYQQYAGRASIANTPSSGTANNLINNPIGQFKATAYGLASIDPTTAADQRKADAGIKGYEGFNQKIGASGRRLQENYSVASNYFPLGSILNINGREYSVDDRGGMSNNVVDFFAGENKSLYNSFANMGNLNVTRVRATGGSIPSTSGIDTIPTMLSGGEFIMNRAAAQNIGAGNLQALNSGAKSLPTEEKSEELNDRLLAKLDELIDASGSAGNITINVDGTGKESQTSEGKASEGKQQLARQIRDAVLKVIQEEKRLGGQLRRGM